MEKKIINIRNSIPVKVNDIESGDYQIKIKFRENPYSDVVFVCYLELIYVGYEEEKKVTTPNQITKISDMDLQKLIWGSLAFRKSNIILKRISQFFFYFSAIATGGIVVAVLDYIKGVSYFRKSGESRIKKTLVRALREQEQENVNIHYEVLNNYGKKELYFLYEKYNGSVLPLIRYTKAQIKDSNTIREDPMGEISAEIIRLNEETAASVRRREAIEAEIAELRHQREAPEAAAAAAANEQEQQQQQQHDDGSVGQPAMEEKEEDEEAGSGHAARGGRGPASSALARLGRLTRGRRRGYSAVRDEDDDPFKIAWREAEPAKTEELARMLTMDGREFFASEEERSVGGKKSRKTKKRRPKKRRPTKRKKYKKIKSKKKTI